MLVRSIHQDCEKTSSNYQHTRILSIESTPKYIKITQQSINYRKKGKSRELWVVLKKDQYEIKGDKIIVKGLGAIGRIEVEYRGFIHLRGGQGRMEIRYDPGRGDGMLI
ncbi:MAG: hypothetical protein ACP5GU_09755 [Thermoprotei archaeon]